MGRYNIKKKPFIKRSKVFKYVYTNEDKERWIKRAKSMTRVELLKTIARMNSKAYFPEGVFPADHPQLIVYREIAGIGHIKSHITYGQKSEISDMLKAKKNDQEESEKFWKEYASVKNRMY